MRCDKGCGACCGPVICSDAEFDAVAAYVLKHDIRPRRQGQRCPLYIDGECSVYPVRPFICRAFGHATDLECERGYNVNIPLRRSNRLIDDYGRRHNPEMLLHAIAYRDDELSTLIDWTAVLDEQEMILMDQVLTSKRSSGKT
jgi:Fe-S-cluster containining protein